MIGQNKLGTNYIGALAVNSESIDPIVDDWNNENTEFSFHILFSTREGIPIREVYIGADNNPITKIKWKTNQQGMANATIDFAFLDFTLDKNARVDIFWKNNHIYQGLIDERCDDDGGSVKVVPRRQRLKETIFERRSLSGNWSAVDLLTNVILTNKSSQHGIGYNSNKIDADFFLKLSRYIMVAPNFEDSDLEKTIDDLVSTVDSDAEWGIDESGIFFVSYPGTKLKITLFAGETGDYNNIKIKTSYGNVKFTRALVYRKGDTRETINDVANERQEDEDVLVGTVGYPTNWFLTDDWDSTTHQWRKETDDTDTYPQALWLENECGVIEDIVSVPTVCQNSTALDYAYQQIKSQQIEKTITITGLNVEKYYPHIGDLIQVEKEYGKKILWTLCDCEATSKPNEWRWLGATKDETKAIEGTSSLKLQASIAGGASFSIIPQFSVLFDGIEFIEFYCYLGDNQPTTLNILPLGSGYTGGTVTVTLTPNLWQRVKIPITGSFYGIRFDTASWNVNIDRIKVYSYCKQTFRGNIKEVSWTVDGKGSQCDVTLGNYDVSVNDTLQSLEWKLKMLENIRNIE